MPDEPLRPPRAVALISPAPAALISSRLCSSRADLTPSRLRSPMVLRCLQDFLLGKRQALDTVACLGLESALQMDAVVSL